MPSRSLYSSSGLRAPAQARMRACAMVLPLPIHYYSPVPVIPDLRQRRICERRSDLRDVETRAEAQLSLLAELGRRRGDECSWQAANSGATHVFFAEYSCLSYGCTASPTEPPNVRAWWSSPSSSGRASRGREEVRSPRSGRPLESASPRAFHPLVNEAGADDALERPTPADLGRP